MDFPPKIRRALANCNLSIEQLTELVGASKPTVRKILRGEKPKNNSVTHDVVKGRILDALGLKAL